MINYFDEREIHPLVLSLDNLAAATTAGGGEAAGSAPAGDPDADLADSVMALLRKHLGPARNYGPTAEALAEQRRQAEEAKGAAQRVAEEERQRREKEEWERQAKIQAEWVRPTTRTQARTDGRILNPACVESAVGRSSSTGKGRA